MPKDDSVLLVEDTSSIAIVYESWLRNAQLAATVVGNGADALREIRSGQHKVVLLDLQLPDMNGLEILETVQKENLDVTVVVVTSSGSIATAVEAMRLGAYDFVVKPAAEERLITTTKNALEREVLQETVRTIRAEFSRAETHGFVGSSLPMIAVYKTIDAVSRSTATIFITGESGTGKEVCAEAIHKASARAGGPFVALNCAAIPKELIESELFGHVRGAFTGATSDREGAAMAANNGTLFLDEIGEMDMSLQSKLLRFLQTGTVQKVGSDKLEKVDTRIVCATNRDPLTEVREGRFREDLYYRLHVVPIVLPPLRERGTDVVEIAQEFLSSMSQQEGKSFSGFDEDAENLMLSYSWPGNVRELQNVIRNAVILNDGELIAASMLNIAQIGTEPIAKPAGVDALLPAAERDEMLVNIAQPFAQIERKIIEEAIARCGDSVPKASAMLDLSPSTIYRKREAWLGRS